MLLFGRTVDDLSEADIADANRGQELGSGRIFQFLRQLVDVKFLNTQSSYLTLNQLASVRDILLPILFAKPLSDLASGPLAPGYLEARIEPIAAGTPPFRGEDFDRVARF